jgi:hypothetical protein
MRHTANKNDIISFNINWWWKNSEGASSNLVKAAHKAARKNGYENLFSSCR